MSYIDDFFLAILNISKKLKNVHHNVMEFKAHYKLNVILIKLFDEEDWTKSMYI
jgi:hypothetical protein